MDGIQQMEELKRKNDRLLQDLGAAKTRALIDREKTVIDAESKLQVAVTKAQESASVDEARATSEKNVAQFEGKKKVEDIVAKAKAQAEAAQYFVFYFKTAHDF
jgi:hypothetical protein